MDKDAGVKKNEEVCEMDEFFKCAFIGLGGYLVGKWQARKLFARQIEVIFTKDKPNGSMEVEV